MCSPCTLQQTEEVTLSSVPEILEVPASVVGECGGEWFSWGVGNDLATDQRLDDRRDLKLPCIVLYIYVQHRRE